MPVPALEKRAGDGRELALGRITASRVAVTRQVDEVEERRAVARHAKEIREASLARRGAGSRDLPPTSALINVDLPTFERPAKAISGIRSRGNPPTSTALVTNSTCQQFGALSEWLVRELHS